jgi:hypothetical protein
MLVARWVYYRSCSKSAEQTYALADFVLALLPRWGARHALPRWLNFIFFSELVFFDHVAEASFGFGQMPEVSVGRYVNMTFDCQFNNNRQVCSEHMLIFWCLMLFGL